MIAKIFSKANPMNFLICIAILLFGFVLSSVKFYRSDVGTAESIAYFSIFFLLVFTVFLTDFIAKKSNLNKSDNYAIVFFVLFLLLIPETLLDFSVVMSNVFVLLAFRRLVLLQSLTLSKQKILDASIWISIACVFEFWSILFFILIFVAILIHVSSDFRNWLIPFVGFSAVAILVALYAFIVDFGIIDSIRNKAVLDFNFGNINSFSLGAFLVVLVVLLIFQVVHFQNYLATLQNSIKKIVALLIIGLFVYLFSNEKNNGFLLFCIAPLSVIGSNFINSLHKEWLKDTYIYVLLILSCISFYLYL